MAEREGRLSAQGILTPFRIGGALKTRPQRANDPELGMGTRFQLPGELTLEFYSKTGLLARLFLGGATLFEMPKILAVIFDDPTSVAFRADQTLRVFRNGHYILVRNEPDAGLEGGPKGTPLQPTPPFRRGSAGLLLLR